MGPRRSLPGSSMSYRKAVRVELRKAIDSCSSALGSMLRYHMGWEDEHGHPCNRESGKFIRPILCLLSCQAVGGDTSQAIPAGAAIELIHNFSLIHDDIEDASYERHHRPTVWKLWGRSQAINAGDATFSLAYLTLLGLKERGINDERIAGSVKMLSQACLELCRGQYLDVEYEDRLDITVEDYLDMAAKKTAALFGASTSLGAYLGSQDSRLVDSFDLFGKEFGTAYQICDDILGIWGTEAVGKSATDISQRKKTLPVVYGLQNSKGKAREKLAKVYSRKSISGDDIAEVAGILEHSGARGYAENVAEQYYHKALAHLEGTRLDRASLAPLEETARVLLKREF